ncbi:MAG: hypothetical protein ACOC11_01900 [Prolixibacteraceae bacterium]
MSGIIQFILVVIAILILHYLLWKKVYKDWLGHLTGFKKVLLIIANLAVEGLIILLAGIYLFGT